MNYIGKALSPEQTQYFAEIFCNDFNPIHALSAGKRQVIPGDWQVFEHLRHFSDGFSTPTGIDYITPLKPLGEFEMNEAGIYLPSQKEVSSIKQIENLEFNSNDLIDREFKSSQDGILAMKKVLNDFLSKQNAGLLLNFLQASGDIGQYLLSHYFNLDQEDFAAMVSNKKILPMYVGAQFGFNPNFQLSDIGDLERIALEPQRESVVDKGNKRREVVSFPFIITKDGELVGSFRKNLLCSYKI